MQYKSEVYGKSGIYAKVVADSRANSGLSSAQRITTLELRFHRFILPEFNTHRMFSRNASSSRAIPTHKLIEQVRDNTAMPVEFGKNKSGMQSDGEHDKKILSFIESNLGGFNMLPPDEYWMLAAEMAATISSNMSDVGYHKQISNRLTECFQYTKVIVTATEWDNFFNLRIDPAAQPEIFELASCMKSAVDASTPDVLDGSEWHMPYVSIKEIQDWVELQHAENDTYAAVTYNVEMIAKKVSVARCARVSYLNHDNSTPDISKDIKLHDMLFKMGHMSPLEHQATPMDWEHYHSWNRQDPDNGEYTHMDVKEILWSANFKEWSQYRKLVEFAYNKNK